MTVQAIKEAITRLPEDERYALAAWLNELDYDDWDKEMVADFSPGGRGTALFERVKRDIAQGNAASFEEGLKQAKARQDRPLR
ncbi:MAG: hypothetical protein ACRD7E_13630 [Bryobacteraceae bacterium]